MSVIAVPLARLGEVFARRESARVARSVAAMHEAAAAGAEVIAKAAPVDQGQLKLSVRYQAIDARHAAIVVDAPHAASVEFGSRPHTPPLGPLLAWARRHGLPPGAAVGIQRKIALYGTRPTHFVGNSLPRLRAIASRLSRRAVRGQP